MKTINRGFTLIELMVVIAVIGILAAIALVSLTGVQRSARDAGRKSDISTYRTALERYYADSTSAGYPPAAVTTGDCDNNAALPVPNCNVGSIFGAAGPLTSTTGTKYLPAILHDPSASGAIPARICSFNAGSNNADCVYKYKTTPTGTSYVIYAFLEASPVTGIYYINSLGASGTVAAEPAAP